MSFESVLYPFVTVNYDVRLKGLLVVWQKFDAVCTTPAQANRIITACIGKKITSWRKTGLRVFYECSGYTYIGCVISLDV